MSNSGDIFDYIIIGGGSSGSILTNRLSSNGSTVCLIEAGPKDTNPYIHIPAGYIKNIFSKKLTWNFFSEPSPHTNFRSFSLPQGRVLGGSSSINGLNYVRGQKYDYDNWEKLGNIGWGYKDILPYFIKSENRISTKIFDNRGTKGELPITDLDLIHPLCEAFLKGTDSLGIPRNEDYNSGNQYGSGYFQRAIFNGLRYSSSKAFLKPIQNKKNVELKVNAQVTSIILKKNKAIGVNYIYKNSDALKVLRANKEIILCAGAINTPKILQLSGIGPASLLSEKGIEVVNDLKGVGNNLRDHYGVRMVSYLQNIKTFNSIVRGPPLLYEIFKWIIKRPSVLSVSPSLVHVFAKSSSKLEIPDLEYVMSPASFKEGTVGLLDRISGMTLGVWQTRPKSNGYVKINSKNIHEPPIINPNYLSDPYDVDVLLKSIRIGRNFLSTSSLQPYLNGQANPSNDLQTDDELLSWARNEGITVYHMIGTAKMGHKSDKLAVVNNKLQVRGIESLRIADASIMPTMPSGNTNAPTMMIAEKASDMILGK